MQLAGKTSNRDVIHGQNRKMAKNARKKSPRLPLDTNSGKQPTGCLAELERRLSELEGRVALLEQFSPLPVFGEESDELQKTKKPGRKERISDDELIRYRDGLVLWLEPYWPWLEQRLPKATTCEQVTAIFEAIAEEPELRPEWQKRLLQNVSVLHEFLWTERFRKTPLPRATVLNALNLDAKAETRQRAANQFPTRQIANAMAGVPEISWRTSLDRCSEQPSIDYVAMNLDMFYRNRYAIRVPEDRDFTGAVSPLPKPVK